MSYSQYEEIERQQLHHILQSALPGSMLVDGFNYKLADNALVPESNTDKIVLPLRYLDGAVVKEDVSAITLYISDSEEAKPYTIKVLK